jgi:hypothetical protein
MATLDGTNHSSNHQHYDQNSFGFEPLESTIYMFQKQLGKPVADGL